MRQVQELKKHNEQLLMSTKSWHEKYEQLLGHGTAIISLMTPKKDRNYSLLSFPKTELHVILLCIHLGWSVLVALEFGVCL